MLDTALSRLPPGGEQILGVIDLKGMSLSNVDLEFVAFMVEAFFIYYPRRCVQVTGVRGRWPGPGLPFPRTVEQLISMR
jgi:hypothetical protein